MILVPSISILNGKVARLKQGNFSDEKVYDDSPIDLARSFEEHGITRLHLIDLDGARNGEPTNYELLELIAGYTSIDINFGGGIHTDGDVSKALEYGAESITASSIAFHNPSLFSNWLISYGRNKIALAADSKAGKIFISGWQKETDLDLFEHIEFFYNKGLKFLKSTDINKDGALSGPSFDLYKSLIHSFPDLLIFASGGIRNMDDIKKLEDLGVYGAIFGKAYYEGNIKLDEIDKYQATKN